MLRGAHRQEHQRANGWAIYWYAWRGGPSIGAFKGATLAEAVAAEIEGAHEVYAAYKRERKPQVADGTVARAVDAFMTSPKWQGYAFKTRQAWEPHLNHVRKTWGHLSGEEFSGDEMAVTIGAWRDTLAERSPATADKAMGAVSRLCSYARSRPVGLLPRDCKPTEGLEKTYTRPLMQAPPRAAVLDAIDALPPLAAAICAIALNTGLRRSDLVRLSETHIDEAAGKISIPTQKGRAKRRLAVIRLTPPLIAGIQAARAIRDATYARKVARAAKRGLPAPVQPLAIIVNTRCAAFTADGLYQHVREAFESIERARINPHDFRRAAATQGFLQGMSWAQIGRQLGWGEAEAETMGAIYVPDENLEGAV